MHQTRLMYGNFQRSGTIKNIERQEFKQRVKMNEYDVILVKQHKTNQKYGSAKVVADMQTVSVINK